MTETNKRYSPYYQFLAQFLERGIPAEIQEAKRAYRALYKKKWRQENRKTNKSITVLWSKEELQLLTQASKKHKQSPTRFIKSATLAYINTSYVVPNQKEINTLIQILAMTYNSIECLGEENGIDRFTLKKVQDELYLLEREMRITLLQPKTIEEALEAEIAKNPSNKTKLIAFITNLPDDH
jgi:hypothetical protein